MSREFKREWNRLRILTHNTKHAQGTIKKKKTSSSGTEKKVGPIKYSGLKRQNQFVTIQSAMMNMYATIPIDRIAAP